MQRLTENDFMTADLLIALDTECRALAALRGVAVTALAAINQSLLPNTTFINSIERNIDTLARANPPIAVPATKTWLGGLKDEEWLNYNDVNRWFESLAIIRRTL